MITLKRSKQRQGIKGQRSYAGLTESHSNQKKTTTYWTFKDNPKKVFAEIEEPEMDLVQDYKIREIRRVRWILVLYVVASTILSYKVAFATTWSIPLMLLICTGMSFLCLFDYNQRLKGLQNYNKSKEYHRYGNYI